MVDAIPERLLPVMYGEHERIAPGTPCLLCGTAAERPVVMDHCHTHGWTRGPLCIRCNTFMAFIDRQISPLETSLAPPLTLAALVEHAARCPECAPAAVADLMPTVSLRSFGNPPAPSQTEITEIKARVPDDIHAALKAMAEHDRRSLNSMLIILIEEEQKRRAVPLH